MLCYSESQVLALITDPGTFKRVQELLKPTKWANLGRTETAAWGHCAGSGSKPDLTGTDLTEPAFKCNCPSRILRASTARAYYCSWPGSPRFVVVIPRRPG